MKRTESDVKEDSRAATSLKTRWRTLQATCSKFAGCYAAIVARNESGKTLEDQVREAHVLYREQNRGPFRSEGVWSVLCHAPKWIATLGLKRKCLKRTDVDANCGDTDADEGETNL
ncbi:DNA binding protein [Phytophthora megakarya]|uniref:DNA binding protein n=1 Tax=Phytophthora megakarya TaxID=4795 RepID=A0A225WXA7_9STRA|nr:DNA binding protein [Phytophthora megakarya]